jgi:pantoate--beta-alanine ligase
MIIIRDIQKIQALRKFQSDQSWGFVPTMGALHLGHISLIKQAIKENDACIVSIFVNPTQFNDSSDLELYPRKTELDIEILEKEGVEILFLPEVKDIYPLDFNTKVKNLNLSNTLEGTVRKGHFDGVCTVLTKFFNIVSPQVVYFGQKDAQQLLIVKKLVFDLNFDIEVKGCPTYRGENGLALSSRNEGLTIEQYHSAAVLYQSLQFAKKLVSEGEKKSEVIISKMAKMMNQVPFIKIDYIAITDNNKLEPVRDIDQEVLVSLAVFLGSVRLIDNIVILP